MFVPASGWTDAAVLEYRLGRWDYKLLTTNKVPTVDLDYARDAYTKLTKASKAEKRAALTEKLLFQKRLILTKLLELRAAASQAKGAEIREAVATISIANDASDNLLGDMRSQTTRYINKMASLFGKQEQLNVEYAKAAEQVDGVAAAEEAEAADDRAPLPAIGNADVEGGVSKPAGAGSSADLNCLKCGKVCNDVHSLASHMRTCREPAPDAAAPDAAAPDTAAPDEGNPDLAALRAPRCAGANAASHRTGASAPVRDRSASA